MPIITPNELPSQDELRRAFTFHKETGRLFWNVRPRSDFATEHEFKRWNSRYSGTEAGYVRQDGYRLLILNRESILTHRAIWVRENGAITGGLHIDHINGIRADNRLENLRLVTLAQNVKNQKKRANNTSGITGVARRKDRKNGWRACVGRKQVGQFSSKEEAEAFVKAYRLANGYSERHGID